MALATGLICQSECYYLLESILICRVPYPIPVTRERPEMAQCRHTVPTASNNRSKPPLLIATIAFSRTAGLAW